MVGKSPSDDAELAAELASLRRVTADLRAAVAEGRPTRPLLRRQAELEEAVRRRTRRAAGDAGGAPHDAPSVEELAAALDDRTLVEIVDRNGRLYAVVVTPSGCRLEPLGSLAQVVAEMDLVRFGLGRLSHGRVSPASHRAYLAGQEHAGRRLEELLLAPVLSQLGDGPLVIVPPAVLHALPWGVLPACRRRPVAVVPSARTWA